MNLRARVSLLLSLSFIVSITAQSTPVSSDDKGQAGPQVSAVSATYADTLRLLKRWPSSEKDTDLARLFEVGDSRAPDLLTACHSEDRKAASTAFYLLKLLGKPECLDCGKWISRRHKGRTFVCESNLSEGDFKRIEGWLNGKKTQKGYECGDYEGFDDSIIYALVLEGSPRSGLLLRRMLAFAEVCIGGYRLEDLRNAQSLVEDANRIGHDLKFEPDNLEGAVRASAFFIPANYRDESSVRVIAYSKARSRILLEVSYGCGLLCGSGYHVVLRKDGAIWQYGVLKMTWIS